MLVRNVCDELRGGIITRGENITHGDIITRDENITHGGNITQPVAIHIGEIITHQHLTSSIHNGPHLSVRPAPNINYIMETYKKRFLSLFSFSRSRRLRRCWRFRRRGSFRSCRCRRSFWRRRCFRRRRFLGRRGLCVGGSG